MGTIQIDGSTPKLTIGNATAEDATILFDGNAQDFYIALDDSADDLLIGLGSTVGTTPIIAIDENKLSTFSGAITVGVDDTGHDVKLFGATSGSYWLWDESADGVVAVSNLQQTGTITVGVDNTGHDVKFFGATSGKYWLWDESADDLNLIASGLGVISAKDLGAGIHIRTSDSGASVSTDFDELVIESSASAGISILAGTGEDSGIDFGDSGDNNIGRFIYAHNGNRFIFVANATDTMKINGDGGNVDLLTGNLTIVDDRGIIFGTGGDYYLGTDDGEGRLAINFGSTQGSGTNEGTIEFKLQDSGNSDCVIIGGEGSSAVVQMHADQSDDAADRSDIEQIGDGLYFSSYADGVLDREFKIKDDAITTEHDIATASVDYAEYFEWKTELANDARITETYGLTVVLDGDKVRLAEAGEEADILGVVRPSHKSAITGGDGLYWKSKWQKNIWKEEEKNLM